MRSRSLVTWTIVFLLVLDLAGRAVATQLPRPRAYSSYNIQRQAERLQELDGDCLDTILLGTSLMGAGGRPTELAAELDVGTRVLNSAVGGGGLLILEFWIEDLVIPSACPSVAVIGLGPRDANDSYAAPEVTRNDYVSSIGRRRVVGDLGPLAQLDAFAERNLGLLQLRTAYREPADAAAFFLNGSGDWRVATNDDGQITFFENETFTADPQREADLRSGAFTRFEVGGRNTDALAASIVALQENGVDVIVVDMPRVEVAHQRIIGEDALLRYEAEISALAAEMDVMLLQADEVPELQNEAVFADEYHLNRVGSETFSRWLGSVLSQR